MSLFATCYPQPGKPKARLVCEAFAAGVSAVGGRADVCAEIPAALKPGAAVFYGVRPAWAHLWRQAVAEGRDWYYLDNSYVDCVRERAFRATKNAVQYLGEPWGGSDGLRLKALGVEVRDWQRDGQHIVVCPQSAEFLETVYGWHGDWAAAVRHRLREFTDRPLVVRVKGEPRPLQADLAGAWALVTHNSAAAVEAVAAGIPAFCTGPSALGTIASGDLALINRPWLPSVKRVRERLEVLADHQWTLEEMARGDCWKAVNA